MPQLIEPDGTENVMVVSVQAAIKFCQEHPGWTWAMTEMTEEDE